MRPRELPAVADPDCFGSPPMTHHSAPFVLYSHGILPVQVVGAALGMLPITCLDPRLPGKLSTKPPVEISKLSTFCQKQQRLPCAAVQGILVSSVQVVAAPAAGTLPGSKRSSFSIAGHAYLGWNVRAALAPRRGRRKRRRCCRWWTPTSLPGVQI